MSNIKQTLRNKKNLTIMGAVFMMLSLGLAIGAIMYSNQLSQQIDLRGIDGYIDLTIETPLEDMSFVGDTLSTSVKIERMKTDWNDPFVIVVIFNNTDTGDLLESQITGDYEIFEWDHTTSIYLAPALIPVQNGTSVYVQIISASNWDALVTLGNVAYLDISFAFNTGASPGNIDTKVMVIDSAT